VTIPSKNIQIENPDREQQEQKLVGMDDESSTLPAGYRYATPESNSGSSHHEPENDADEIWYPTDINPEIPEEQNHPDKPEENPRKESETSADKPKGRQSQKGKESEESLRVSSRTNKGQNNDAFTKKHYTTYISFVAAQIAKQFVPQSLKEALEGPNKDLWYEACKKQLAKIEKKESWELCHLPKGEKALPTKWVFDPKLRARLVVCGNFEKKSDVETFAAVVDMIMVKLFFLFVAVKDWECLQFDFEATFLNGQMSARLVYVKQPPGFGDGTKRVCKLLKTLYGLRDSPLVWFREATALMKKAGFEPLASQACVFTGCGNSIWIILYVDDMAIAAATKEEIESIAKILDATFTLMPLGEVDSFLGLEIIRDRKLKTIKVSQGPYIRRVLEGKRWLSLNGAGSPLDVRMKYDPDLDELEQNEKTEYLELVGSAQWVSNNSHPDVAYAANFLGRHRQKPTSQHMEQLKRLWRYLSGTRNLGLTLGGERALQDLDLWLHCDASWADDIKTRKTTASHIIYVGDSPIKWQSKQQDIVTLSTTEAEFVNMSTAGRDMMWIRRLFYDMKIPVSKIPMIGTDSKNALLAAESDRQNMSTRHTDVRYKWVKERVKNGELTLRWIDTDNMKADGLTKVFNPTKQAHFVRLIGLSEVVAQKKNPDEDKTKDKS
jgi:hypothetical protein